MNLSSACFIFTGTRFTIALILKYYRYHNENFLAVNSYLLCAKSLLLFRHTTVHAKHNKTLKVSFLCSKLPVSSFYL